MKRALLLGVLLAAGAGVARAESPLDAQARLDYMLSCQGCHLPDGSGFPGKVPDMRGVVGRFMQLPAGREFVARVPGVATSSLPDDRLAVVVNWMLREFSAADLPADFVPYTAEELGRLRKAPLTDVLGMRTQLLVEIGKLDAGAASR